MEVIMNTKLLLENRQSVARVSVPSTPERTCYKVKNVVRAVSVAAIFGLTALSTAYAGPATSSQAATVELAGYEVHPHGYHCVPLFRGKYTGWRCESLSAAGTRNAIAKTP
jgi:hypothetical protein